MGNQLAKTTAATTRPAELLSDLPNVVYKDTLGGGRVLKTFACVHDEGGLVVVKVYLKREGSPDLDVYKQELARIRDSLVGLSCPHLWPFQTWFESDNKAFLLRQYIFSNLYERISTRPFLSFPEKNWICFQLLYALGQSHAKGVYHGDIKCENVLVTSWNWVYLTDFASAYKPTYLPADNPADFSFYFDAGSRRRCYLAPERFIDKVTSEGKEASFGGENNPSAGDASPQVYSPSASQTKNGGLTGPMDIFSLGCVLAELYMEGRSLFDLSELHAYRRGEYDPATVLQSKVKNVKVRTLILHMIQLDPSKRLSAREYLDTTTWIDDLKPMDNEDASLGSANDPSPLFPGYMSQTLHGLYASLLPLDPDGRLSAVRDAYAHLKDCIARPANGAAGDQVGDSPEERARLKEGMMVLAPLFCSLLRNTKTPSSKCSCIRLLCESGMYCDDEKKMQHVVPYLISMVNQGSTIVRSMALSALTTILKTLETLPESEEKVFSEYIFPSLALLCSDSEEMVRVQFSSELPKLIRVACRLLHIPLAHNSQDGANGEIQESQGRHKPSAHLPVLKKEISKILIDLTTGGHSTSATIQATMQNYECFCDFFGVQETNNLLLPLFITFLNHNDWQVRRDFFIQLPIVCKYTVPRNGFGNSKVLEAFLIPCIEQAFVDPEPEVLASSLGCLCELVGSKSVESKAYVLEKSTILSLIEKCKPFLGSQKHHPESQQRHASPVNVASPQSTPIQVFVSCVKFVAACARRLSQVDIYAHMLPRLRDVSWLVDCPNLRDERCIFDSLSMQHVRMENSSLNQRYRMQDSRLSHGIAIYSVAKSDFLSTPEHSIHAAVRTGALPPNSNLKKVLHSTAMETQRQASGADTHGLGGGPSASISLLNESNFFGQNRQGDLKAQSAAHQRNISDAVVDALSTGVSGHANPNSYSTYAWQPQGILISHLAEHKRAVNKLSVSQDSFFLTSASDDGTCKIWDCRKLEKDISFKSRLTYSRQGGRILSCASLLHSKQSVASASSDGSVHVWNVEYATRQGLPEKYTGVTQVKNVADDLDEGAALCLTLCGEHLVCYGTEHGNIHAYDHRVGKDAWVLDLHPSHGTIKTMLCKGQKETWLAAVTNVGVVSLFDLRFLMCAKQWQHPKKEIVACADGGSNSEGSRIVIAAGDVIKSWTLFGKCVSGGSESLPVSKRKLAEDIEGHQNQNVRALLGTLGGFLTAGMEREIKMSTFDRNGVSKVDRHWATGHKDCILDLTLLQERIILSCSRDGIIKGWK